MELRNYETVFILTPVLSDEQTKDAVQKFKDYLTNNGAEIYHEENWGLKKLAYPIKAKSNGFYYLMEFKAPATLIKGFETEYRRDERVIRSLVVSLDKYAVEFNQNRRAGKYNRKPEVKEEVAS